MITFVRSNYVVMIISITCVMCEEVHSYTIAKSYSDTT